MKKRWLSLPLSAIIIFALSGFGCMGTTASAEASETAGGTSWWIILIYLIIFIDFVLAIIAIPLFITGIIRVNRCIDNQKWKGEDASGFISARTKLVIFFVLALILPIFSFIFFILLAVTRSSIAKTYDESWGSPTQGGTDGEVIFAQNVNHQPTNTSNAEELGKYKDLLDKGAISQEEYDALKKKLLGL